MRSFLSPPAVAMNNPSGDHAAPQMVPEIPSGLSNSLTKSPSLPEYKTSLESEPAEKAHSQFGEYRTVFTKFECAVCDLLNLKGGPSWKITDISSLPVMMRKGRSDLKEIELICFVWPATTPVLLPVSAIIATALSWFPSPHATTRVESPLHWPSNTAPSHRRYSFFCTCSPFAPQTRMAPPTSPETIQFPLGDIAAIVVFLVWPRQQNTSSGVSPAAPFATEATFLKYTPLPLQ
mmetsp:Transcript_57700/g.153792  ORF Transcript_57700/g.153792 Transcript_57700/m.153792 type:complete len:235 (+) Transcript_57700:1236-1940(+)